MDRRNEPAPNRGGVHSGHPPRSTAPLPSRAQIEAAAEIFRALGDPERLRLLLRLARDEACVSELAEQENEKITTVSARLKVLSVARLVRRRREAKQVYYTLADEHVLRLIRNAIDHAAEGRPAVSAVSDTERTQSDDNLPRADPSRTRASARTRLRPPRRAP